MKPLIDFIHTPRKSIRLVVRARGSGWQAQFNIAGRQHRTAIAAPNKSQALLRGRELVLQALELSDLPGVLRLERAAACYLDERWPAAAPNDRTRNDHARRLATFTAQAGADTNLAALTYDQAAALFQKFFSARRKAGDGARTLINYQAVLNRFCRWLLGRRGDNASRLVAWKFNPASRTEHDLEAPPKTVLPAPTMEMTGRFLLAARGGPAWPFVLLAFGGGLRSCEISRAKWEHLNELDKTLLAYGKKRHRLVHLSDDIVDELLALKKHAPFEFIAQTRTARHSKKRGDCYPPYEAMRRARTAAALPAWVNFQSLRRAVANFDLRRLRVDQYAQRLGHNLRTASEHYLHFDVAPAAQNVLQIPALALKASQEKAAAALETSTKTSTSAAG